jgi:hypothetical protein
MVFASMDDSFESYYQAVRRCYRFGQSRRVLAHIITADTEGAVKGKHRSQAGTKRRDGGRNGWPDARNNQETDRRRQERHGSIPAHDANLTIPAWILDNVEYALVNCHRIKKFNDRFSIYNMRLRRPREVAAG